MEIRMLLKGMSIGELKALREAIQKTDSRSLEGTCFINLLNMEINTRINVHQTKLRFR